MTIKPLLSVSLVIFLTMLGAVLITKYVGPLQLAVSQVTTNKSSSFDVVGESEVTSAPDEARVSLGMRQTSSSVQIAQDQVNDVMNKLTSELKNMGIKSDDIKTTNYNVYPEYNYDSPERRITGYTVSTNIEVKIRDLTQVNNVIDKATALGANEVNGVSFTLSEDKEKEIKKQARQEAIEDAKTNAQELANLAGMKLGKVINVMENQPGTVYPVMMEKALVADGLGGGAPTEVQPGTTTYTYQVTVSYETL